MFMGMPNQAAVAPIDDSGRDFERELAQVLVSALNLELSADEIAPEAPLFGDEGIGLDSIDVLEIALTLSKKYGVELRSDDQNNTRIFASLRSLAAWVQAHRTR